MNDAQKKIADNIIEYFKEVDGIPIRTLDLPQIMCRRSSVNSIKDVSYVAEMLVHRGLLHKTTTTNPVLNPEMYYLSTKGWIYESYDNMMQEEQQKRDLERRQIQSSLDTNSAVQANFTSQEKYNKRTLLLAALSVLFIGITAYLQATDKTAKEVKELRLQVQKTSQTLDSIRLFHKEIDASLKSLVKDYSQNKSTK